jgi:hypothetical protein
VVAGERNNINVESLLAIVRPCAEDISPVRNEIIERWKHFYKTSKLALAIAEIMRIATI